MADIPLATVTSTSSGQIIQTQTLIPVSPDVLKDIEHKLEEWNSISNWLRVTQMSLGVIAIACSLFITAFAGADFLDAGNTVIRILAFITTLFLTLMTSFNISSKANSCRNAWRHLNKALYSYKSNRIDGDALIKAYEEGENILGSVDFNFNKTESK